MFQDFLLKEEYRVLDYSLTTVGLDLVNVSASWDEVRLYVQGLLYMFMSLILQVWPSEKCFSLQMQLLQSKCGWTNPKAFDMTMTLHRFSSWFVLLSHNIFFPDSPSPYHATLLTYLLTPSRKKSFLVNLNYFPCKKVCWSFSVETEKTTDNSLWLKTTVNSHEEFLFIWLKYFLIWQMSWGLSIGEAHSSWTDTTT